MASQNKYRKINIFYADDLSDNVRVLLDSIQRAGLIFANGDYKNKLILNLPDKNEHYEQNKRILQSDRCLINIDYSTKINDSIEKINNSEGNYDLVICDLYFGDNDEQYVDSKIGGIWLIYWAMHLSRERKIICKLYSGQLATVRNHIDFKKAIEFIQKAYKITVEEIEKSYDSGSWREHLQTYLDEVRLNIIPQIELNDRVNFVNYLAGQLRRENFINKKEDKKIDLFKKDLLLLKDFEFNMIDGRKMKLIHLFPIVLGSHFATNDKQNFANMDADLLERTLYKNELIYNSREERNIELQRLQKEGVQCEDYRTYDETGRPVYGIRFHSRTYDLGVISQIENSFIQTLDWTYQIHKFYSHQKGFRYWSRGSAASPIGSDEFNQIRKDFIFSLFEKIKDYFKQTCPNADKNQGILTDQIEDALTKVDESHFWNKYEEQQIEHGFLKLKNNKLFNDKTKVPIIPLKALFRINVPDFLRSVPYLKEGKNYSEYENDEFQRIKDSKFYWYCNACIVREGIKDIVKNMQGDKFIFYLLESKEKNQEIIKYKIILKDFGRGIPSIIRKFFSDGKQQVKFYDYLKGFCQLTIRSKIDDYEGISFNVFTGKDEIPCSQIKETGTEFEFMFTKGRER